VIWGQTYWPDNGTLRAGFLHVHAKRFEEIWVFAASAAQLGLNVDPLIYPSVDPKDMFIPSEHANMTNSDVKEKVMANFAAASNRKCEFTSSGPEFTSSGPEFTSSGPEFTSSGPEFTPPAPYST
jgi:hypothetical protein